MTTVNPPPGSPSPLERLLAEARDHHRAGRFAEAAAGYRQVLAVRPKVAELHNELGSVLAFQRKFDEARSHYERALTLKPDLAQAYYNLANLLRVEGKLDEALLRFEQLVALMPRKAEAHNDLANMLMKVGKTDEAIARFQYALSLKPDLGIAHNNLSALLRIKRRFAEAQAHAEKALAINPNDASAHGNLATILRHQGKFTEALARFDRALSITPTYVEMYYDRGSLKTFAAGDPDLAAMETLAANAERLPPGRKHFIHFGLAKALDDIGQYDRAFGHWLEGNKLKRQEFGPEGQEEQMVHLLSELFTPELYGQFATAGDRSPVPIFIVGMPRSGTSLIEQILASHPLVEGGGELSTLGNVICAVKDASGQQIPYPLFLGAPRAAALKRLGERYLAMLPPLPAGKTRLSDKMPGNFMYVGLIRLALPNAKIIHAVRNPIDTCLSCFTRLFSTGQAFSYDLAELGRYYRVYRRLMDHWQAVLPPGSMLEVRYEDVVDNLEQQARRLVEYCGLPWDPACLAFHKNERLVSTASDVQVRRPIYRSSVARWRRYQQHLGPLLAELGDLAGQQAAQSRPLQP